MPKHLGEAGRQAWKDYIEPATWLTRSREITAILLCELWEESRQKPLTVGKHQQIRAYMTELGLTDERNRYQSDDEQEAATDELFD